MLFGSPIPGTITNVPCTGGAPDCGPVSRSGHEEDSKLTGKVSLNYKPDDNNFLYAFFATGHKDGGQNTTANQPAFILPEEVRNFEVGWKWSGFDGHVHTQLDGYWNDYKNFQVSLFDPTTQTSPIRNAPSAKIYGIEAQAQAAWEHLSFDVGASWLNSRFGSFFAVNGAGTPGDTCNLHSGGNDPNCTNLSGEQNVYAPQWTLNGGVQYVFNFDDGDTLTPRIDYAHVGPQWTSVFHSPLVRLGTRDLFNAQLSYDIGDAWDITAYSTNLFDLRYIAAENVSLRYAAPPRQFGIRVTRTF